jgi:hypothetical protein
MLFFHSSSHDCCTIHSFVRQKLSSLKTCLSHLPLPVTATATLPRSSSGYCNVTSLFPLVICFLCVIPLFSVISSLFQFSLCSMMWKSRIVSRLDSFWAYRFCLWTCAFMLKNLRLYGYELGLIMLWFQSYFLHLSMCI